MTIVWTDRGEWLACRTWREVQDAVNSLPDDVGYCEHPIVPLPDAA